MGGIDTREFNSGWGEGGDVEFVKECNPILVTLDSVLYIPR